MSSEQSENEEVIGSNGQDTDNKTVSNKTGADEKDNNEDATLRVRRRKVANVIKGEPWVYPNAILSAPDDACLVRVVTEDNHFLGWADYNPAAPVRARILTRDEIWPGDKAYIATFIEAAITRRLRLGMSVQGGAFRLINNEGDSMPGLVVDQFGHALVIDIYSVGMLKRLPIIQEVFKNILDDSIQYIRLSADSAKREGCLPIELKEESVIKFSENGVFYSIDLLNSQKTGYFLDQRDNRRLVAQYANDRTVLDLFSYQGGFALSALAGGAIEATAVDSSEAALKMSQEHAECNNLSLTTIQSDVFKVFDQLDDTYDMIICDPPKLAPRKSHHTKALSAYRFLSKQCLLKLNSGGLLLVSSCSQIIQCDDLQDIVLQQANKLNVQLDVIAMTHQPADHPWPLAFSTSRYLSSILVMRR